MLPPFRLFLFCLLSLPLLSSVNAWYDENCGENGQCTVMFKSFENLIRGEGCRSFYITGKCSRICTYSLRSLVGRHTWSKCAQRCEWSKAATDGISSWLDMCLANPAPDVFKTDDADDSDHPKREPQTLTHDEKSNPAKKSKSRLSSAIHWVIIITAILVSLFVSLMIVMKPTLRKPMRDTIRSASNWVKRMQYKYFGSARRSGRAPGRGPLDGGPDRNDLKNLQLGARRHLKALRATLD